MKLRTVIVLMITWSISACVPQKQFKDMKSQKEACETERTKLRADLDAAETNRNELQTSNDELRKNNSNLQKTMNLMQDELKQSQAAYNAAQANYLSLKEMQDKLLSGKDAETKKAIAQFQKTQSDLLQREDSLKKMEADLNEKSLKLKELQDMLAQKDAAVKDLKKKVTDALVGFTGNGLTIEQKNGKIYVSLEEQLLFSSGSTVIDQKGKEALKKLAKVLEQNKDINVLIEGNTDNVPILGGPIKDNWDLSVMRATSVVRILMESAKLDAKRLTPAGRGEFAPLTNNSTPELKKKNRRIDIILTPKLDELLKLMETN